MPDLKSALALARLAVSSGYSGNTGNTNENCNEISVLDRHNPVATAEMPVATVATFPGRLPIRIHSVATVATVPKGVATTYEGEKGKQNQRSIEPVASVATVASDFKQAGENPGVPAFWLDGILSLSLANEPCPGFRSGQWLRTYDVLHDFITGPHAAEAARYGWTTEMLFGVHPVVGLGNVASCGALILAHRDVIVSVDAEAIRFANTIFYRPRAITASVPIWSYGPGKAKVGSAAA